MMTVAIDQPNYIPWKGYFDLINDVDLFVFYTDVQYTHRDWRNRNKIITPNGEKWLSVPCGKDTNRLICDVIISDHDWQRTHYETIKFAYGKAPYFSWVDPFLREVYLERTWDRLVDLDVYLTEHIARDFLGIKTKFADSREYMTNGVKHERLLGLIENIGATVYESGPLAKNYMIDEDYREKGIELRWKSYEGYPEYSQLSDNFNHNVSIIDLLCNTGEEAWQYVWGWRDGTDYKSWIRG